jgi:YfiH family protein
MISYVNCKPWAEKFPELIQGITTRETGFSTGAYHAGNMGLHVGDDAGKVIKNRILLCQSFNLSLADWVSGEQIHGCSVAVVNSSHKGMGGRDHSTALAGMDALVTDEKGILLAGYFADCVPILFFNPVIGLIGLAHAGWRGTKDKIVMKVLEVMSEQFASRMADTLVWVAPAIGPCCYRVDQSLAEKFSFNFPEVVIKREEGFYIDLPQCNILQMTECGIEPENVYRSNRCTMCEKEVFFSHRSSGPNTGRMAAFIAMK